MPEETRLTQMTKSAGCAAKLGKGVLAETLASLPRLSDLNLLVGFDTSDDACVYKIRDDLAVIQTVDFFPPMVDDPYLFGQIAAANAFSDVYAMGASPSLALNLLCVPKRLPIDQVKGILEGGHSKAAEAGAVIAGGHTIVDPEPKYGLCASGFIHPDKIWSNSGAVPGDVLVLTKPLGTGIATTAAKVGMIDEKIFGQVTASMATLNKRAYEATLRAGAHAVTDVTGFGLIGHACEMAEASVATIEINSAALQIFPEIISLAQMGIIPEGAYKNRDYAEKRIRIKDKTPVHIMDILFDPQTSGGLLVSLPEKNAKTLIAMLEESTPHARIIGRVLPFDGAPVNIA